MTAICATETKVFFYAFCEGCGCEVLPTKENQTSFVCTKCEKERGLGIDPKNMTKKQLKDALQGVDEERSFLRRSLRGKTWSLEDLRRMRSMDLWAEQIWEELMSH